MANPGRKIQRTLLEAYADVVDALPRAGIRFVLHGEFAMATYGYERATKDVDFLVPFGIGHGPDRVRGDGGAAGRAGSPGPAHCRPSPPKDARHVSFNLAGWLIDFSFDADFDAIGSRAMRRRFGGRVIDVISARDLAERKAQRGTLQDLADLEKLGSVG